MKPLFLMTSEREVLMPERTLVAYEDSIHPLIEEH